MSRFGISLFDLGRLAARGYTRAQLVKILKRFAPVSVLELLDDEQLYDFADIVINETPAIIIEAARSIGDWAKFRPGEPNSPLRTGPAPNVLFNFVGVQDAIASFNAEMYRRLLQLDAFIKTPQKYSIARGFLDTMTAFLARKTLVGSKSPPDWAYWLNCCLAQRSKGREPPKTAQIKRLRRLTGKLGPTPFQKP